MKSVSNEQNSALDALHAGADILLVPENPFALIDSLNTSYTAGKISDETVNSALTRQDELIKKACINTKTENPDLTEIKNFLLQSAPQCLAWISEAKTTRLKKGDSVRYIEIGKTNANDCLGQVFIDELKNLGISVFDAKNADDKTLPLISASFSRPQAFSGNINLSGEERKLIKSLSAKSKLVMVSFGSPFVFEGIENISAGLSCFCAIEEFQKTAAQMFLGLKEATGKMPIKK